MRHGKKFNHLGRKSAHRKAMLANMSISLIAHKRITTTLAKAKALRKYIEPLLTRSKDDTTHNRRVVFRHLQNKLAIQELFGEISNKIADRQGGYTRIIKLGARFGDAAEMAMIELVDFNELMLEEKKSGSKKKRRRRGGKKSGTKAAATPKPTSVEEAQDEVANAVEETANEAAETVTDTVQEVEDKATETVEVVEEAKAEETVEEEATDTVQETTDESTSEGEGDASEEDNKE